MNGVHPLYVKYRELESDVKASFSDKSAIMLDYLKQNYNNEPFHINVFEAINVNGLSYGEVAEKLNCSEGEISRSLNATSMMLAFWKTNQSIRYDDEKTRERHPDILFIKDKEYRINNIKLSSNKKEMHISLLDKGLYNHDFYYYLSKDEWLPSEFNGRFSEKSWQNETYELKLPEHPVILTYLENNKLLK